MENIAASDIGLFLFGYLSQFQDSGPISDVTDNFTKMLNPFVAS